MIRRHVQAVTLMESVGDRVDRVLWNLANTYLKLEDFETAVDKALQALAIAEDLGDIESQLLLMPILEECYTQLGDAGMMQQALVRHHALLERAGQGAGKMALGLCSLIGARYFEQGELRSAMEWFEKVMKTDMGDGGREEGRKEESQGGREGGRVGGWVGGWAGEREKGREEERAVMMSEGSL